MEMMPAELSVRELRATLADVINAAATRNHVTFVTSRGRRVAAVVSVAAAEQAAVDGQASHDAITATSYAVNLQMLLDRGGTPSLSPAECFENYADDLLRELSGSSNRALAAARAVAAKSASADETGYPTRWRHVALAVELCQRAAEMTGQVLPGSYRPGSRVAHAASR